MCFSKDAGNTAVGYSYGGDDYTGMQNAAVQTANTVLRITEVTRFSFSSVLLIWGLEWSRQVQEQVWTMQIR